FRGEHVTNGLVGLEEIGAKVVTTNIRASVPIRQALVPVIPSRLAGPSRGRQHRSTACRARPKTGKEISVPPDPTAGEPWRLTVVGIPKPSLHMVPELFGDDP